MNNYVVFAMAFAASAAAPGPEVAALLGRTLSGGMRSSIALAVGIVTGKLLLMTAAAIGLGALATLPGPVFLLLKILGALYLFWLGIRRWRNAGRVLDTHAHAQTGRVADAGAGLAMTLSNPMAVMFYLALMPTVIDLNGLSMTTYAVLCVIIAGIMSAVALSYGIAAETARRYLTSPAQKVMVDRAAGAIMMGAGALVAFSS